MGTYERLIKPPSFWSGNDNVVGSSTAPKHKNKLKPQTRFNSFTPKKKNYRKNEKLQKK